MATMFIRHRVADYAEWKAVFDEDPPGRRAHGGTGHSIHRDADDPNVITVTLRFTDVSRAKEFARLDSLRAAMERAGVLGTPEIWVAEDIEDKRYG